jgi:WhiB family transcriptional regulator, redox-sensing transcriptional regulator
MPSIKAHDAQHLSAAFDSTGISVSTGDIRTLAAILTGKDSLIGADLDWQDRAICPEIAPDLFFPEKDDGPSATEIKAACFACPVRRECLTDALNHMGYCESGRWGVWGGTSAGERRALMRRFRDDVAKAVDFAESNPASRSPRKAAA